MIIKTYIKENPVKKRRKEIMGKSLVWHIVEWIVYK